METDVLVLVQSVKIYWSIFIYYPEGCTTTSLIISYKNQPLLLSLDDRLEEKNSQISGA